MAGAIIVSIFGASLVVVYMLIVNRFLRSDEHYHSQTQSSTPTTKPAESRAGGAMNHAHA